MFDPSNLTLQETTETMFAQLGHNICSGDNKFISEDADGNVKVLIAIPELLLIESDLALANEIRAYGLQVLAEATQ
jgi:hypothetical protein